MVNDILSDNILLIYMYINKKMIKYYHLMLHVLKIITTLQANMKCNEYNN